MSVSKHEEAESKPADCCWKCLLVWPWPFRWWLAAGCVAGPFVAIVVLAVFYSALIAPALYQDTAGVTFHYTAATPQEAAPSDAARSDKTTAAKSETAEVVPDATMFLPARDYAGRVAYAIASAFLAFAALTTLFFSSAVVFRFLPCRKGLGVAGFLSIWTLIAFGIAWSFTNVHGRYLVVRDLLDASDRFPGLAPFMAWCHGRPLPTGQLMESLVFANTALALLPIGMLLMALALVTGSQPPPSDKKALATRRFVLRCLLWLASASFVMGVLCNKALVEWPLTLVSTDEVLALRPIADSLVLQFGALGSAAIFLAFAPAVAAWLCDVHALRMRTDAGGDKKDAAGTDELQFAPPAVISSIVAIIAPLLASPVADSLKSVLAAVSK